ncbi:hypothetical protein [Noviherbaspirillum sp.]|uniref:hypothetical protein n=1 Tax=Noviherbaspirillum sp. TaxID=1926288 RepID=UPI002FE0CC95
MNQLNVINYRNRKLARGKLITCLALGGQVTIKARDVSVKLRLAYENPADLQVFFCKIHMFSRIRWINTTDMQKAR